MGLSVATVVLEGDGIDADTVRRALWLPRKPDVTTTIEEVTTHEYDDDHLGIFAVDGRVHVFGWSVTQIEDAWLALTKAGGRAVVMTFAENFDGNSYEIFEGGEKVRGWTQPEATDGEPYVGEPHALDPEWDEEEHPAEVVNILHKRVAGEDMYGMVLDKYFESELPAWRVSGG